MLLSPTFAAIDDSGRVYKFDAVKLSMVATSTNLVKPSERISVPEGSDDWGLIVSSSKDRGKQVLRLSSSPSGTVTVKRSNVLPADVEIVFGASKALDKVIVRNKGHLVLLSSGKQGWKAYDFPSLELSEWDKALVSISPSDPARMAVLFKKRLGPNTWGNRLYFYKIVKGKVACTATHLANFQASDLMCSNAGTWLVKGDDLVYRLRVKGHEITLDPFEAKTSIASGRGPVIGSLYKTGSIEIDSKEYPRPSVNSLPLYFQPNLGLIWTSTEDQNAVFISGRKVSLPPKSFFRSLRSAT